MYARTQRMHGRQRGFTMLELMVTIAVLAIIMGMAAPSFRNMMLSNSLSAAGNEVIAALQLARMEAVRRRGNVEVCPTTDGEECGGDDWARFIVISGTEVLREVVLRPGNYTVRSEDDRTVEYTAMGLARQAGWIASCAPGLSSRNRVVVEFGVGRVSSHRETIANCTQ